MDRLLRTIRAFDGVLELAPVEGDAYPETTWDDHFFYYAPDGRVPSREQPYATIVTKNYPGDVWCDPERPGRWRLNIHVGADTFAALTGESPRAETATRGRTAVEADVVLPHPVYRAQGWVAIVDPGVNTHALAVRLLRRAHERAKLRMERRSARGEPPG